MCKHSGERVNRTKPPLSQALLRNIVIGISPSSERYLQYSIKMDVGTNGSNDLLMSRLPLRVFVDLISRPRSSTTADPTDASSLRGRILSKLSEATNANAADDGSGGSAGVSTVRDVLRIPPHALVRVLDPCLTHAECVRMLSRVHREYSAEPRSAMEVVRRTRASDGAVAGRIPTGLPTLDARLGGGIPVGSITEVVGRAGTGKTHMAQQLAVSAAIAAAGGGGGTVYVDAERKLSLPRLREIALERAGRSTPPSGGAASDRDDRTRRAAAGDGARRVLENVTVHGPRTTRELLEVLDRLDGEILARNSEARERVGATATGGDRDVPAAVRRLPVRLVVVDTIAAPLRHDFEVGSSSCAAARRASAIFQVARRLKRLAHDHRLAVVVVNQVGSSGGRESGGGDNHRRNRTLAINDGEFAASLGTAWQYCATTRVVLEHEDDPHRLRGEGPPRGDGGSIRVATLTKSLVSKRTKIPFELTRQGLREVSPSLFPGDPSVLSTKLWEADC